MAGGWPSRIVGRSVGLRGGTARQSRPRGSVLGSAASRCVGFPLLPHSLRSASSVAPTSSTFVRPLDSRRFSLSSLALPSVSRPWFSRLVVRSRVLPVSRFPLSLGLSVSSSFARRPTVTVSSPRGSSPIARNPVSLLRARVRHAAAPPGAPAFRSIWSTLRETRERDASTFASDSARRRRRGGASVRRVGQERIMAPDRAMRPLRDP